LKDALLAGAEGWKYTHGWAYSVLAHSDLAPADVAPKALMMAENILDGKMNAEEARKFIENPDNESVVEGFMSRPTDDLMWASHLLEEATKKLADDQKSANSLSSQVAAESAELVKLEQEAKGAHGKVPKETALAIQQDHVALHRDTKKLHLAEARVLTDKEKQCAAGEKVKSAFAPNPTAPAPKAPIPAPKR